MDAHSEALEFSSSKHVGWFAGAVCGVIGLGSFLIGCATFAKGGVVFALLIGPVTMAASLALTFGRRVVRIDMGARRVSAAWTWLHHRWEREVPFERFREIGVHTIGAGSQQGGVKYKVMLKGPDSIYLPGRTYRSAHHAIALARDLAGRMGIAVDETPRLGFFGN
ncbi:MAG: hypothetical protein ACYS22_13425 [Planctomycetota bacterium]|jgi:hypothetical protein